jgi:hypothetical protein
MKRIAIMIMVLVMLFALAGCTSVDNGTVVEKAFTAAHRTYVPLIMHINKTTRIIPRWINHPDTWRILVENDDHREWWNVTEDFYNSVDVGDYVDRRKQDK